MSLLNRLERRLYTISEDDNPSFKDPHSGGFDRQYAEDCLFHTVGPLTDNPRWVDGNWTSPGYNIQGPPPEFEPGGPAPKWTPEEIVYAMAGDPSMLFRASENPRSPGYGDKGGAPLFRLARKIARIYNRQTDKSFIEDLYMNGMIPLMKMMQPGFDEGRSPFISFAIRSIESAMGHGTGGSTEGGRATGEMAEYFVTDTGQIKSRMPKGAARLPKGWERRRIPGLKGILNMKDPAQIRQAVEFIDERFRTEKSYDKHPGNPLGPYTPQYYQAVVGYAEALESRDRNKIEDAKAQIQKTIEDIDQSEIPIRGASTGLGQAVSTLDRAKDGGVAVQSINVDKDDQGRSLAADIADDSHEENWLDPDIIKFILDLTLKHSLQPIIEKSPKYKKIAAENGAKVTKDKVIVGGTMSVQELRYLIRAMGPLGENYPGKGVMRSNTHVPRDGTLKGTNWWMPGEDPEMEPVPTGGIWRSYWSRRGYQPMGPTAIADEMTREVREFMKYGIQSARTAKVKTGKDAVTKVAVGNTIKAARVKLHIMAMIHKEQIGMAESVNKHLDQIDRSLIAETCEAMVRRLDKVLSEVAPPGWSSTVKDMKKHKEIDNPFALAWSMHKKGAKPSKKSKSKNESVMKPVSVLEYTV